MKINQVSSGDSLVQQVLTKMMLFAFILEFAEFYKVTGNADSTRKTSTSSGGDFRALNDAYADNKKNPLFADIALKILGDQVQVDRAHERRGADIASVRATELLAFAENFGKVFQDKIFNGDPQVAKEITGLKNLVPNGQKLVAAENGLSVLTGNDNNAKKSQQSFIELINQLIEMVAGGAQVIFMDGKTLARLTSIAREYVQYTPNEFGVLVPSFNGVPIRAGGFAPSGDRIIPHSETVGTANGICTSIYAMRFGEKSNLSIATNKGIEVVDQGLVGNHYVHSVEIDLQNALLNDKAIAKLEGIIIA